MKHLLRLALASAWNRRFTLLLTLFALSLSVAMLLGVERVRTAARHSAEHSISGTDLIVGARGSAVQLLLHAVFHLGEAGPGMSWASYQEMARHPLVKWAVPLSLSDSHEGFPVLGTTETYFERYRYALDHGLVLQQGRLFGQVFEAVIGAEVAERLGYQLDAHIVLNHGDAAEHAPEHEDKPFRVVGILKRTGTPVDRTIHVNLASLEAIHLEWQAGAPIPGFSIPAEFVQKFDLRPKTISAMLIGLESRAQVFRMQRAVGDHQGEPLQAVLPGVAFDQLWIVLSLVERLLQAVSALVVAMALSSMVAIVWAGLSERRRELAILRSVGAGPLKIAALLALEGLMLSLSAALFGELLLNAVTVLTAPAIQAHFGLTLPVWSALAGELQLLGGVLLAGLVAALLPAWRASRIALADGLTPRL